MPDNGDPRPARGRYERRPHQPEPDWVEDDPTARPSFGVPKSDTRPWWRLQPGMVADGKFVRRSTIHGGTCRDWPAGRHPPNWMHLTRPEVRRLITRPDEVQYCPVCRPWIGVEPLTVDVWAKHPQA